MKNTIATLLLSFTLSGGSLTLLSTPALAEVEYLDPVNTTHLHRLERCIKTAYGRYDLMGSLIQCNQTLPVSKRKIWLTCIDDANETTANFEAFRLMMPYCISETFGIEY